MKLKGTYEIITSPYIGNLVEKVNDAIRYGYIPVGGVAQYERTDTLGYDFMQAVVKEPIPIINREDNG